MTFEDFRQIIKRVFDSVQNALRVTIIGAVSGSFSPSGLMNGGRDTRLNIPSNTWTQLLTSPIDPLNSIRIQNVGTVEIKTTVNADPNGDGQAYDVGITLPIGDSDFLDIQATIPLWVRAKTGTGTIILREIG